MFKFIKIQQFTFFLAQVTVLGIQGSIVKALGQSEQIGWWRPLKKAKGMLDRKALFSELELQTQKHTIKDKSSLKH